MADYPTGHGTSAVCPDGVDPIAEAIDLGNGIDAATPTTRLTRLVPAAELVELLDHLYVYPVDGRVVVECNHCRDGDYSWWDDDDSPGRATWTVALAHIVDHHGDDLGSLKVTGVDRG